MTIQRNSYLWMWSRIKSLGPGGIFTSLRALKKHHRAKKRTSISILGKHIYEDKKTDNKFNFIPVR